MVDRITVISDRIFWIYFIIVVVITIIGASYIISFGTPYILLFWILANVVFLLAVYYINTKEISYLVSLFFAIILITTVIWTSEINGDQSVQIVTTLIILLLSIYLAYVSYYSNEFSLFLMIIYIIIWLIFCATIVVK